MQTAIFNIRELKTRSNCAIKMDAATRHNGYLNWHKKRNIGTHMQNSRCRWHSWEALQHATFENEL